MAGNQSCKNCKGVGVTRSGECDYRCKPPPENISESMYYTQQDIRAIIQHKTGIRVSGSQMSKFVRYLEENDTTTKRINNIFFL
jgi:hypothetical protein